MNTCQRKKNIFKHGKMCFLFQISVPMSVEFEEITKMRENTDDSTSKISLLKGRSGGSVVDSTLDYQSRDGRIHPPLLRSFG